MEISNQQQIMTKDKVVDRRLLQESNSKPKQEGLGISKQQQQQQQQQKAAAVSPAAASPPSSSSSPNHEFSFTISLHHSSSNPVLPSDHKTNNKSTTSTPPPSAFAIDLSPADDIFFHGHLLPLHLLSHLPTVSPRSSTNSMDSFTLPIREMIDDDDDYQKTNHKNCSISDNNIIINNNNNNNNKSKSTHQENNTKGSRTKSKSFSLFKFTRRKKGFEDRELPEEEEDNNRDMNKQKKRLRFDHVSHVIKKYMKMVRPLLFKRRENQNVHFNGQAYSFSGNLMSYRNKQDHQMMMRSGKRGEFSAPASIRTSPTNSGLLVATTTTSLSSSTSDSTMEELQAAIQAAIAHCKNSIAVEDKLKC
ncbi:hypothetical protein Dsin_003309 [Dipteronia sinensis]|uniref:BRI1 kinase inhibitor 1 n=1 Tax=Dipteronia sinensis TaxID=43782 RepID=A0AAE0EK40_9ROSI|nr:hypothetical protein Dsin_003309 [Dipteronia sinensis]